MERNKENSTFKWLWPYYFHYYHSQRVILKKEELVYFLQFGFQQK